MKKIMLVFGTRPEGIKMCPLVNELKRRPQVQTVVCVTGQHKQMLQQVLDAFSVVPDYDLAIMQPNQTLFDVTTAILTRIQAVLNQEKPDLTLVHGDTSTAFVTALACFYLHIPVGHVEAGLRTYNLESPFPEEFNRQAISLICRYHFAPTEKAKQNLLREGKDESSIFVTGNTSIDALKTTVRADYTHPELTWAKGSRLILITAHRRENLGEAMHHMFRAIRRVLTEHPDVKALYPIHLNPVVRQEAAEELSGLERLHIIEPLDVLDFHNIMAHSTLKDWTLDTVIDVRKGVNNGVYMSCFSEEIGHYRGFMLRQDNADTLTVYVGNSVGVTVDLPQGTSLMHLVVVKSGSQYTIWQDGQLVQRVESACDNYDATLLLGAQRDADGNLFRFSNAGIRTLNITDGALPDTDAAALSAPVKDNSRF
jgi:UDP-N-acetylglucosamine 2-epimerase